MKIYFIRHGESEANVGKIFSNRGLKHGLTLKGMNQVHESAKILSEYNIDFIYSSPLLRAQQTTEILQQRLKCNAEIEEVLREADAGLEDRSDMESWQKHIEIMQRWLSGSDLDRRINDGESFNDIKARFTPFIEKITQDTRNVLLVGHGGLFCLMFPLVFENIDNKFIMENHLPNCSIVIGDKINKSLFCIEWCGKQLRIPDNKNIVLRKPEICN